MSTRSLTNVPEEDDDSHEDQYNNSPVTPTIPQDSILNPAGLYKNPSAASSTSTITALQNKNGSNPRASSSTRRTPSVRTLGGSGAPTAPVSSTVKRSSSSNNISRALRHASSIQKFRSTPRLPHDKDAGPAPSTAMYWSRAPVYGRLPMRTMRAHSVTLVDTVAWIFGGCDDKETKREIYCFDTETMQWTIPETTGDIPPLCRAHSAALYERKIIIFGGGIGGKYYDDVFVLDTVSRRWIQPKLAEVPKLVEAPKPAPRRAHTAVIHNTKMWIFGGGNGLTALNDVWTLDVSAKQMRWREVETSRKKPGPRGYHSTNLINNIMVVVGGSDGKDSFTDVWCLNLDTLIWTEVAVAPDGPSYCRLSHSATQVGSYLFLIGGHNSSDYISDLVLFNLVNLQYEERVALGKPPCARGYHACILSDSRIFLFGGYNGATAYDDVHILDLAGSAYLPQVTSFNIDV